MSEHCTAAGDQPAGPGGLGRLREIDAPTAMSADWMIRELAVGVLSAVGLSDDAADLAQLEEITPVSFGWPGLLERPSRILTAAGSALLETFLAEHHACPGDVPPTHQVLREGLGTEALDAADDARIGVLPHQVGQHAYYAVSVGVQLLHFRHGPHSAQIRALRDGAQVAFVDLQQDLASWRLGHPEADSADLAAARSARTAWPLPVRVPPQHWMGA